MANEKVLMDVFAKIENDVTGVIATAATSLARAADMPLPPPLEPAPAGDYSGWYIRADVGVGSSLLDKFSSNAASGERAGATQQPELYGNLA